MTNRYLSPKKHSLIGKHTHLKSFISLINDREEWTLDEIVRVSKEKLDISPQTVWNYLLELNKKGNLALKIVQKEKTKEGNNPSMRRIPLCLQKKGK